MNRDDIQPPLENNITDGLPEGWCWAELNEIVTNPKSDIVDGPFGSDLKSSEYTDKGTPIIRIQNVDRNEFIHKNIKFISSKKAGELKRHNFRPGDIVLTKLGDPLGKACIVPENFGPGIIVADIVRLRLNHQLCFVPYLIHAINSDPVAEQLFRHIKGTTRPRVNLGHIRSLRIPLAPLSEQKRIVVKVEELLARVNATKESLAKVSLILKRFRQAVLSAACSGRLTCDWRNGNVRVESGKDVLLRICGNKALNQVPSDEDPVELPEIPKEWVWSRCEYLCEPQRIITYGVIKLGPAVKNGIGTLRSSDVRWLYIDKDYIKFISPKIAAGYSRTFLKGGEILITVRGSLGGVAVVPKEMAGYNISREVAMLPLYPEFCPQFFSYAIASIWSQNWLSEVTKGVAYTGINIRDLKRLPLPIPPIAEQYEIVRRVEAMFKLAEAVEKRVSAAAMRAEKLTQAILAKAFSGELVPTEAELARREGRSYESASELLARIKEDREREIKAYYVSKKKRGGCSVRD